MSYGTYQTWQILLCLSGMETKLSVEGVSTFVVTAGVVKRSSLGVSEWLLLTTDSSRAPLASELNFNAFYGVENDLRVCLSQPVLISLFLLHGDNGHTTTAAQHS